MEGRTGGMKEDLGRVSWPRFEGAAWCLSNTHSESFVKVNDSKAGFLIKMEAKLKNMGNWTQCGAHTYNPNTQRLRQHDSVSNATHTHTHT